MTINSYKREILYIKAQGRSLFARNKEKINVLLGLQADETLFLSLTETDNIISELKKKRQIFCEFIEFSSVTECFKFTSSQIEDRQYYLLMDEDWKYCGAYKIENDFSFSAEFDFDKPKSDEIRLISIDFCAQISIDYSESCGEKNFEVRIRKYERS